VLSATALLSHNQPPAASERQAGSPVGVALARDMQAASARRIFTPFATGWMDDWDNDGGGKRRRRQSGM